MEKIKNTFELLCSNTFPNKNSGDIMQHLPTLYLKKKTPYIPKLTFWLTNKMSNSASSIPFV
jgi:hypothetical protein